MANCAAFPENEKKRILQEVSSMSVEKQKEFAKKLKRQFKQKMKKKYQFFTGK